MSKKEIIKRLNKNCSCCGRKIKVILYSDRSYRGGHYFGEMPLCKKDLKPYKHEEYWECPKCY